MTVREALREGVAALGPALATVPAETPFLDASLLLAAALGIETSSLLASGPLPLDAEAIAAYRSSLARRSTGFPVAYLLGWKEFWGRRFAVDPRVLVPRPDTELLVSAALECGTALGSVADPRRGGALRVHECCCGSGCVILSLGADRPGWRISASDLSPEALDVASANARSVLDESRPGGPCEFSRRDLLELLGAGPGGVASSSAEAPSRLPLSAFDLVLANPPYVPSAETEALMAQGWGEPRMALDGGVDGLGPTRRLLPQAFAALAPGGYLLAEADGAQAGAVAELCRQAGFAEIETLCDLAGIARVTRGRKPWTR